MNNDFSQNLLRARVYDEKFAISKLAISGYKIRQATHAEDLMHKDIVVEYNGVEYGVDVKRNDKKNVNSKNFCFTYESTYGYKFPFKYNAYFFFIDELNYKCYLVVQTDFEQLLNTSGVEYRNASHGKAKFVRISDVANIAKTTFDCDEYDKLFLQNT